MQPGMALDTPAHRPSRPGILEGKNPGNGLYVLRVHYSADPEKRDPAWKAREQPKHLPRNWDREYEIAWTVPEGEPVIPEYNPQIHGRRGLRFDPKSRLLRFWDFGFNSPVVLFAQVVGGQLRFLRELCPFNTSLRNLIPMMEGMSAELAGIGFPTPFDAGDPEAHSEKDLGVINEVLLEHGIFLRTLRPGTEQSYQLFRNRLMKMIWQPGIGMVPAVVVDTGGCPNLAEALAGAFHRSPLPPYKPVRVHPYTDCVDAARYGSDNLESAQLDYTAAMARMAVADVDPGYLAR